MNEEFAEDADAYLEHLKASRRTPAVLKLELAQLRASLPDIAVFAFEGDDDKIIYAQWIKRIREMEYEPFPCGGKSGFLMLRGVILRDRGDLGRNVFFFVDRDYDDLRGEAQSDNVFMTDNYSIENYLVTAEVLIELLKNEFHCHARPDVRNAIKEIFSLAYDGFLDATREVNRRIYVARKLRIELARDLPKRVGTLARVELERVARSDEAPEEIVVFSVDPAQKDWNSLSDEFDKLDSRSRYRGKFALLFFQQWLRLLVTEYGAPKLGLFKELSVESKARSAELVVSNFASKSQIPTGLAEFINAV